MVVKRPIINKKGKEEMMILLTDLTKNKFNTYGIVGLYAEI